MAQRLAQHPCFVLPLELRINAGGAELYAPFCGEHVGTWLARATAAGWDTDALAAHVGAQLMIALHELRQQVRGVARCVDASWAPVRELTTACACSRTRMTAAVALAFIALRRASCTVM